MNLKEFQEKSTELIKEIDKKYGRNHDVNLTLIHLIEELGEIAREIYNKETGRGKIDKNNLSGEFSDALMLLAHLASCYGIDIEESVKEKFSELKERFELSD
jgi:NTP pyrophosphatase (non-canonical NTP hydrolase)